MSHREKETFTLLSFPSKKKTESKFKSVLHKEDNEEKESPKIRKLVLKWENKLNVSPLRTSDHEKCNKRFKKVSLMNKTAINFDYHHTEEESFVNLISRFRF